MTKETYLHGKIDLRMCQRGLKMWQKRPTGTASPKRDLSTWQKRPTDTVSARCWQVWTSVKRDLLTGKRDLLTWQKRPTDTASARCWQMPTCCRWARNTRRSTSTPATPASCIQASFSFHFLFYCFILKNLSSKYGRKCTTTSKIWPLHIAGQHNL